MKYRRFVALGLIFSSVVGHADEDKIELETTRIKANKELPQILYMVPWKDFETPKGKNQKLRLHDFFGGLYDPLLPSSYSAVAKPD